MAVTDAYFTAAQYRSAISKSDTGDDAQIAIDAVSISNYIARRIGRFFTRDSATVPRVYLPDYLDGSSGRTLIIHDLAIKVGLIVTIDTNGDGAFTDETALVLDTDYILQPEDAEFGPEPAPWTRIELAPWGSYRYWPRRKRVQVMASFGWPAIPTAVQRGAIDLCAIMRLESPRARREFMNIDQAVEMSPEAQRIVWNLIKTYRRVRF